MPGLIVLCCAVFSLCPWEVCSFLGGAMGMGWGVDTLDMGEGKLGRVEEEQLW